MKVIIDIPEEIYQEAIKSGYSYLYDETVANAVANGSPLDDVKAEMLKYSSEHYVHDDNVWCYIGIIDRLIGKVERQE